MDLGPRPGRRPVNAGPQRFASDSCRKYMQLWELESRRLTRPGDGLHVHAWIHHWRERRLSFGGVRQYEHQLGDILFGWQVDDDDDLPARGVAIHCLRLEALGDVAEERARAALLRVNAVAGLHRRMCLD